MSKAQAGDLIVLRVFLVCQLGHDLGELEIDRDTRTLTLTARSFDTYGAGAGDGEPLHYAAGKLRYRCPSCVRTTQGHRLPAPPPRAIAWRTVAALAAALAVAPEGQLNRRITATAEAVRDAQRALMPDAGEPRSDRYAEYWAAWREGPRHAGGRRVVTGWCQVELGGW